MSIIKCCKQFSCILHLHLASRVFLFSVFCFLSSVYAFDVSVNASVSASQVYIGDVFTYRVEVTAPKGASVELPSFVGNLGSFEVRDWNTSETPAGETSKTVWTATLNTFVSGDFALAPQQVVVVYDGDSVQTVTDPVPVRVSMRTTDADMDILEVEEPMEMPGTPWYVFVLIALGILLVAGLVYFAIRNWKRTEVVRILPPYEEAVLALKKLKDGNLSANDQAAFFMELGVVVRRYVERRFGTPVLDATPSELKLRMSHVHGLQESFKQGVITFSIETEPVKFANMKLEENRIEHWLSFADELIETTKPIDLNTVNEKNNGITKVSQVDANIAGILCLLLGPLGIHDVYCGNKKSFFVKIGIVIIACILIFTLFLQNSFEIFLIEIVSLVVFLCFFVLDIWTIIDLVKIGKGFYKSQGKKLTSTKWCSYVAFIWIIIIVATIVLFGYEMDLLNKEIQQLDEMIKVLGK